MDMLRARGRERVLAEDSAVNASLRDDNTSHAGQRGGAMRSSNADKRPYRQATGWPARGPAALGIPSTRRGPRLSTVHTRADTRAHGISEQRQRRRRQQGSALGRTGEMVVMACFCSRGRLRQKRATAAVSTSDIGWAVVKQEASAGRMCQLGPTPV